MALSKIGEPTRMRNLILFDMCGSAFAWPSAFSRGVQPLQVIISPRCVVLFSPVLSGQAHHLHGSTEPGPAARGRLDRTVRLSTTTPWLSPLSPSPHVTVRVEAPAPACPRTSRETLRWWERRDCRHGLEGWGKGGGGEFGSGAHGRTYMERMSSMVSFGPKRTFILVSKDTTALRLHFGRAEE